MKKIIEGKIYDTEKAEVIFSFRRKYQDPDRFMELYGELEEG